MKKPYRVEKRLGQGPWHFVAAYATQEQAQKAIEFWNSLKGAVNNEPFQARLKGG